MIVLNHFLRFSYKCYKKQGGRLTQMLVSFYELFALFELFLILFGSPKVHCLGVKHFIYIYIYI